VLLTAAIVAAAPANAQEPAASEKTMRDLLVAGWLDINQRIVKMAEDFPESKYEFQATKDVRSFADVLRHVAFWNDWATRTVRGEKPDGRPNELPKAQYASKAQVVAALKKSVDAGVAQLKAGDANVPLTAARTWLSFISHSSEHYGQLVVYYRLNGLVPPASRPQ
jgi:uncharacterized damage-inducible protein DinB